LPFGVATFLFWTALYLYVPILPVYTRSIGASFSMVGVVIAAYAIPQMLLRIPIGLLFDVTSHRKLLLFGGIVTTGIGALGLGLAPTPWLLFLSRAITGIGAAAWVAFTVYFTAYYPREGARRAIGIINFVQGSAVVVATLAGGLVAERVWPFLPWYPPGHQPPSRLSRFRSKASSSSSPVSLY
jgi:MFS family permease